MTLKYHISPSALSEDFIVRIWEASNDGVGAHVYETTLAAPHSSPATITVNGLDKVVHIIRMYGDPSGNLLHEYNAEPRTDLLTVFSPVRFKIGDGGPDTPAADTDTCTTPEIVGLTTDEFVIHRANYGPLHPTTHFTFNSGTGEWTLTSPDLFNANEEFTIQVQPVVITTVVNDSVVGKWVAGFVDVSANTSYSATHLRKLIRFAGQCTYTFQIGDTIPIGYGFVFQNFGTPSGTQICTVQFLNGNLKWGAGTKTTINLPLNTEACFVWDGTTWNVVYISDSRWIDSSSAAVGDTLGAGQVSIGDVLSGDQLFTITHNLDITGDYAVFFSLKANSSGAHTASNRVTGCWYHDAVAADKKNKFYISLQELAAETQNLSIVWVIIKL